MLAKSREKEDALARNSQMMRVQKDHNAMNVFDKRSRQKSSENRALAWCPTVYQTQIFRTKASLDSEHRCSNISYESQTSESLSSCRWHILRLSLLVSTKESCERAR